jgi:hypothetical protein
MLMNKNVFLVGNFVNQIMIANNLQNAKYVVITNMKDRHQSLYFAFSGITRKHVMRQPKL